MENCNDCKYRLGVDYGYSNYTVEGTLFVCLIGAHPDGEFDRFYGEDKRLWQAALCPNFELGPGADIDVDREGEPYSDDPEIVELIKRWEQQ